MSAATLSFRTRIVIAVMAFLASLSLRRGQLTSQARQVSFVPSLEEQKRPG